MAHVAFGSWGHVGNGKNGKGWDELVEENEKLRTIEIATGQNKDKVDAEIVESRKRIAKERGWI